MTGHAFQVLLTDDEARATFASVHAALTEAGRFAFETRNPLARAWERWTPEHGTDFTDAAGAPVWWEADVDLPVEGDIVRFASTYSSPDWDRTRRSQSTLRFVDAETLSAFLTDAGLAIEEQFGDWNRSPLTETSPEIITIARRVGRETPPRM